MKGNKYLYYKELMNDERNAANKMYYILEYLNEEAPGNTKEMTIDKLIKYFSLEHEDAKNIYDKWKKEYVKAKYEVSEV
ncbi:hypothetical protein QJR26_09620 [Clostridium baratii]